MSTDKAAARGRPSTYSQDLADRICERLADGETLRAICRDPDMPNERTVRRWVLDNESFAPHYARARDMGYAGLFDQILEIADNPEKDPSAVNRDRLKIDARKWMLAKALPKVYGDRLSAELTGKDGAPLQPVPDIRELARDVAFIFAAGMQAAEQRD